jgi:hypothetical protein
MKPWARVSWACLGAAIVAAPFALMAAGQTDTGAASTLSPLEVIGQGARPLAMGSAFTAVKGDPMAALFNPAGQAYLSGAMASAHHNAWLGGISQDSLCGVIAAPLLSVGLYGDLINYGSIDTTDNSGNVTGSYDPMDYTLGLCLAKVMENGLALGGTVRGTQQNIKDSGQLLSSADVGLMWSGKDMPLTLGASYDGISMRGGVQTTAALRVGGSVDVPMSNHSGVLFAFGGEGENNGASLLQLGVEGRLGGNFFMRVGYQASFMDNQTGGLTGLTSGLGAVIGPVVVDYAYLPYGRLGNSNRVSLSFLFDDGHAAPKAPAPAARAAAPKALAPANPVAANPPAKASMAAPVQTVSAPPPAAAPSSGGQAVDMVFEVPMDPEEAKLVDATHQAPNDPGAWNRLGHWYYDHGRRAPMVEAYRHYLLLEPRDTATAQWLAKVEQAPAQ